MNATGPEGKASQYSKRVHEGQGRRLNCNEKQQCENSPHLIYVKAALSIFRLVIFQTMQHSITLLGTFYVSSLHGYMLVLRALPPPPAFFLQQGLSLIGGGLSVAFYRRPDRSMLQVPVQPPRHKHGGCQAAPTKITVSKRIPTTA